MAVTQRALPHYSGAGHVCESGFGGAGEVGDVGDELAFITDVGRELDHHFAVAIDLFPFEDTSFFARVFRLRRARCGSRCLVLSGSNPFTLDPP